MGTKVQIRPHGILGFLGGAMDLTWQKFTAFYGYLNVCYSQGDDDKICISCRSEPREGMGL